MNDDYPNLGTTRWIVEMEPHQGKVVLDDGSRWQLDLAGRDLARTWEKSTTLVILRAAGSSERECTLQADNGRINGTLLGFVSLGH